MKPAYLLILLISFSFSVEEVLAQGPGRESPGFQRQSTGGRSGGGKNRRGRMGPSPANQNLLLKAIDTNGNLEISAEELQNAGQALLSLDANEDGRISANEMRRGTGSSPSFAKQEYERPPHPPGQHGPPRERRGSGPPPELHEDDEHSYVSNVFTKVMWMDTNRDGVLESDEVSSSFESLLRQADSNKDQAIDHEELVRQSESVWREKNATLGK